MNATVSLVKDSPSQRAAQVQAEWRNAIRALGYTLLPPLEFLNLRPYFRTVDRPLVRRGAWGATR